MGTRKDITGNIFGMLIVIGRSHEKNGSYWNCKCECGNETIVLLNNLKSGRTKSCGCNRNKAIKEKKTKHGMYETKTYKTWAHMIQRCNDKNYPRYNDYGGRGIKVCDELLLFDNFIKDMGERKEEMTLDRIDNNKGYSKENCRWSDVVAQANNKRNNDMITFNNKTQSLYQWSRELNIKRETLKTRLYQLGWTIEKAFTTAAFSANRGRYNAQ